MKILFAIASLSVCLGQLPAPVPKGGAMGAPEAAIPPPAGTKLALSEIEDLQKQVLQLRKRLIQCQLAPAETALSKDLSAYVEGVLKAHGNPAFKFNVDTFEFEPVPVPASKKEPKKDKN